MDHEHLVTGYSGFQVTGMIDRMRAKTKKKKQIPRASNKTQNNAWT